MKVIRITSCAECPFCDSEWPPHCRFIDENGLTGSAIIDSMKMIKLNCPLEDE